MVSSIQDINRTHIDAERTSRMSSEGFLYDQFMSYVQEESMYLYRDKVKEYFELNLNEEQVNKYKVKKEDKISSQKLIKLVLYHKIGNLVIFSILL